MPLRTTSTMGCGAAAPNVSAHASCGIAELRELLASSDRYLRRLVWPHPNRAEPTRSTGSDIHVRDYGDITAFGLCAKLRLPADGGFVPIALGVEVLTSGELAWAHAWPEPVAARPHS